MPSINLGNNEVGLYRGATQQSFIRGGSVPRSIPPRLIDHIWQKKGTPFFLFDKNGTLFTYLVQNFASLQTAANALSFKYESNTKPERFLYFSGMKLLRFSKTREYWSSKAAFTITFFVAVNHIYDHKQRTLKHRNTQSSSKSTNHKSQTVTFWTR